MTSRKTARLRESRGAGAGCIKPLHILLAGFLVFAGCQGPNESPRTLEAPVAELDTVKLIYKTKPERALEICDILLSEKDEETEVKANALIWKARTLTQMNEFARAVDVWNELFVFDPTPSAELNFDATSSLAILHYRLGNSKTAFSYFRAALKIAEETGDPLMLTKAASNISTVHNESGSHDSALYYENLALRAVSELNDDSLLRYYQIDLGAIYLEMEMYDSAFHYLSFGIKDSNDSETKRYCHLNLGLVFQRTNKPDSAYYHYNKALKMAHAANDRDLEITALENLGYLSNSVGQYEKAFEYLDSANTMEEKNDNVQISERINELEMQFQNLEREKEVERLRFETDRASLVRNTTVIIAILVVLIAALVIGYVMNRLKTTRTLAAQQAEQFEKEKEVVSLQSMLVAQEEERKRIALDLHDGIGIILSTARIKLSRLERNLQESERQTVVRHSEDLIDRASQELRRVAQDMMPAVLTKLGLIEGIEDLMERLKGSNGIDVSFTYNDYETRFSGKAEVTIFRVIQELLNNGIKHSKAGKINLDVHSSKTGLIIKYTDNGVGFDARKFGEKGGLGLKSIGSRVKFMSGTMEVKSSPGMGTSYIINIPHEG